MSRKMKCTKCEYGWNSRKKNPKECPRCKYRLDSIPEKNSEIEKKYKLNKVMKK